MATVHTVSGGFTDAPSDSATDTPTDAPSPTDGGTPCEGGCGATLAATFELIST